MRSSVVTGGGTEREGLSMSKIETWHRRHALQLACQLPESRRDALLILEASRDLVENFIDPPPAKPVPPAPDNNRVLKLAK